MKPMEFIKLLESKGILKGLPKDKMAAGIVIANRIANNKEVEDKFLNFAFNMAINFIIYYIKKDDSNKVNEPSDDKQTKETDDIDAKVKELTGLLLDSLISGLKSEEKEGK